MQDPEGNTENQIISHVEVTQIFKNKQPNPPETKQQIQGLNLCLFYVKLLFECNLYLNNK